MVGGDLAGNKQMGRMIAGVVAGVASWLVTATVINLGARLGWPAYAIVEKTYEWSFAMQVARLSTGVLSSIGAGYVAARIAPASHAALWTGVVMVLLSLPTHYINFAEMPLWYHAFYLLTLAPFVLLGQRLAGARS